MRSQLAGVVLVLLMASALHAQAPAAAADQKAQLLTLLNEARKENGLPPLTLDPVLSSAAQRHAALMAAAQRLSHDFSGEPPLVNRLAAEGARLDSAAENVAESDSV